MLRVASSALILLALFSCAFAGIRPRAASVEDLLQTAETWILDFDEDDDERLSATEMEPLLDGLRQMSSLGPDQGKALTADVIMRQADGDGDGHADRAELLDLLKRMKGFDGGHISRERANTPSQTDSGGGALEWNTRKSNEATHAAGKKRKKRRRRKDEM